MSIIAQLTLFSWEEFDRSAPIVMLERTLDALPDEQLLEALARKRKGRRERYPVVCMWRAFMACALLGHGTRAALIAELRRNAINPSPEGPVGIPPVCTNPAPPNRFLHSTLSTRSTLPRRGNWQ